METVGGIISKNTLQINIKERQGAHTGVKLVSQIRINIKHSCSPHFSLFHENVCDLEILILIVNNITHKYYFQVKKWIFCVSSVSNRTLKKYLWRLFWILYELHTFPSVVIRSSGIPVWHNTISKRKTKGIFDLAKALNYLGTIYSKLRKDFVCCYKLLGKFT